MALDNEKNIIASIEKEKKILEDTEKALIKIIETVAELNK